MDAQCNACGRRVMPYSQYIVHFRPTAVCLSCGANVRLRHYVRVLAITLVAMVAYSILLVSTKSLPLMAAGLALGTLFAFLADFWTFKNLHWDPVADGSAGDDAPSA